MKLTDQQVLRIQQRLKSAHSSNPQDKGRCLDDCVACEVLDILYQAHLAAGFTQET